MKTLTSIPFLHLLFFLTIFTNKLEAQSLIVRHDGSGAGHQFLDLTDESRQSIVNGTYDGKLEYNAYHGPVYLEVLDTTAFEPGEYQLRLIDDSPNDEVLGPDNIRWELTQLATQEQFISPADIAAMPVQEAPPFGLRLTVLQTPEPTFTSGAIGSTITYKNPNGPLWLDGVPDELVHPIVLDMVQGSSVTPNSDPGHMGQGFFFPYQMCLIDDIENLPGLARISPAWMMDMIGDLVMAENLMANLNNVDLVFTSDKSLWSRCVVIETASPDYYDFMGLSTQGAPNFCEVVQFDIRTAPSVGKNDSDGDGMADPDGDGYGMAWFPGYAVDVETGQRLNVYFGENSAYSLNQDASLLTEFGIDGSDFASPPNGEDMMWNPSSQQMIEAGNSNGFPYQFYLGGHHFLYITNEPYDSCTFSRERLDCMQSNPLRKVNALKRVTWTGFPMLATGSSLLSYANGLIPNDVIVKLRVDNPFQVNVGTNNFNGYPTYRMELAFSDSKEATAAAKVKISPNPTQSQLNIQSEEPLSEVLLTYANGQIVQRHGPQYQAFTIDLGGLANGVYFLRYTTLSGKFGVEKVVRM